MRNCKFLCGVTVMMALVVSSFLVASIAVGSPIDWSYEQEGETIEWQLAANQDFEQVRLTVTYGQGADEDIFVRHQWRQGESWTVTTQAPSRRSVMTLAFDASLDGQHWSASVDVPVEGATPGDVIDFELTEWEFETGGEYRVRFRADQPVSNVMLEVRDVRGAQASVRPEFSRLAQTGEHEVSWFAHDDAEILMFSMTLTGQDGGSRQYHYVPWSLGGEVQHLNFEFNSAEIADEDRERLAHEAERIRAAIEQVGEWVDLELYVAGYTDTVGSATSNRELSRRRAAAIAEFFAEQGISIPLRVQGFGEDALAVDTPDQTRASANRRAVFVLRAGTPPQDAQFPRSRWDQYEPTSAGR